ncbi:ParB/RepB/Spo0J family partition protein [Dysgonomonas sp. PFB1-18]|uniref:ParB/RepB/Spo0J family partition protein n=1 Tax=unclassified Dysgonomonas TaxID=2630389 RepID=UPI0024742489|nr:MULTISPECIES: ParB/RepB/Spo0J family partition protein [unclassified Dysgonomonas]MDH6310893.1 ParB/RepB/Spo0J family partition protein [Dysgonomonas sp. PF1-14]MDH6341038.1 ParB/RepB/Spo0J family partition protein [Dysgonomonas sp. PF1-16]MDH6382721.1 ParB/RepB/Spo0J family partition protein [Dysgonomonas sp. PFB1-18]MDH6400016.1 ParB/RepB/Spo0J family partition protein [Dysgonomonas sp. PF1-23]
MEKIEGNKYALHNSYFKNKKQGSPDTLLEIVQYWKLYGELPFNYTGDDWLYQTVIERQKKRGVILSQYPTPDCLAKQLVKLTDNFLPKNNRVLNACCGIGQITKYLLDSKLDVTGFDIDEELVELCRSIYPDAEYYTYDYREEIMEEEKWDLIISNPPLEKADLHSFLSWLSRTLSDVGYAIILLPKDYLGKTYPPKLHKCLRRFDVCHKEAVCEESKYSMLSHEICILSLTEEYKKERTLQKPKLTGKAKSIAEDKIVGSEDLRSIEMVPLDKISPNPFNPRKRIKQNELISLSQGIKEIGLIQAITLRPKDNNCYEIVCGERRYHAFLLNKEEKIPAFIKEYTDEQVLELAIAENVHRENLTVMEEVNSYKALLDNGKWTIDDIARKFGQKEMYIKNRLRLLLLIPDFQNLLDDHEIKVSIGIELTKYTKEIQGRIYKEHFVHEDSTNWKDLSVKEFITRTERIYTNDLSVFPFDKTECNTCPMNTGTYNLFGETGNSRCTDTGCLEGKKREYMISLCKAQVLQDASVEICVQPYDRVDENLNNILKESGVGITAAIVKEFPPLPEKPDKAKYYKEEDYIKAHDEYLAAEYDYSEQMEKVHAEIKAGNLKKGLYVGDGIPRYCIIPVDKSKENNPVKNLEEQNMKNKDNALKQIFTESLHLLKMQKLPGTTLSLFEDELFIFILLDYLDKKDYPLFGITNPKQNILTDKDKDTIIKTLSPEQRGILIRSFMVKYFASNNKFSPKLNVLLPQLAIQYYPAETKTIVSKHMDTYRKSNEIITSKIKKYKEKTEYAKMIS